MTPEEYLDGIAEPRRSGLARLDELIRGAAPALERVVQGGMLGYGPYRYRYDTGRELGELVREAAAAPASRA